MLLIMCALMLDLFPYFKVCASDFRVGAFVCQPATSAPILPSVVNNSSSCLLSGQEPYGSLNPFKVCPVAVNIFPDAFRQGLS